MPGPEQLGEAGQPTAVKVLGPVLSVPLLELLCALCCLPGRAVRARCRELLSRSPAVGHARRPGCSTMPRWSRAQVRSTRGGLGISFHRRRFGGPRGPRAASGHGHFRYRRLSYRTVWASGHPPVLARPAGIEPVGQTVSRSCWSRHRELVALVLAFGLRLLRMARFVPRRFGTFLYFVALDLLGNIMSRLHRRGPGEL